MNVQSLAQAVVINQPMMGFMKVKGMATDKELRNFAYSCVLNYATFCKSDGFHSLDVSDLPDFTRHEFAALIMANDDSYASEACGPDNKHWDDKMLPSLLKYLKNTTDKDEEIEFVNTWRDCVASYCESSMQGLIDDALTDYDSELGNLHDEEWHYGIPARGEI